MTGLIPSGGTSEISALDKLLTLLLDPKAAQTKLDELRGASAAAEQMIGQANASMAKRDEQAKAFDARESKLAEAEQSVKDRTAALDDREANLKTIGDNLIRQGNDVSAAEISFASRVAEQSAALASREQALADKTQALETQMASREQTVSEREIGAKATFDEAQAAKADYEGRVAKLNAAMGK